MTPIEKHEEGRGDEGLTAILKELMRWLSFQLAFGPIIETHACRGQRPHQMHPRD